MLALLQHNKPSFYRVKVTGRSVKRKSSLISIATRITFLETEIYRYL